jgi:hypothetical protein
MGWRPKARSAVLKRARPQSPSPADRMPIQPGLGAIDIFDPKNIILPSKKRMEKLRGLAIAKLWCSEGIELLWDAVMRIDAYKPTAKRFATLEMRKHMDVQMQSFRREQVRRFVEEIKKALDLRATLPDDFQAESQYTSSYWNWEFKNLSFTILNTLQEVDWLSEDAKPKFRSPALAMAEFRMFVNKEVRKYYTKKDREVASSSFPKPSPVTQLLSPTLPRNTKSIQHTKEEITSLEHLMKNVVKLVPCTKGKGSCFCCCCCAPLFTRYLGFVPSVGSFLSF